MSLFHHLCYLFSILLFFILGYSPLVPPGKSSKTTELSTKAGSGHSWLQKETHNQARQLCTQLQSHTYVGAQCLPWGTSLNGSRGQTWRTQQEEGFPVETPVHPDQAGPSSKLSGLEPWTHIKKHK